MYKYIARTILSILCLTALFISTMSCINVNMPQSPAENKTPQGDPAVPTATVELPTIDSFSASPALVLEGKSSTLSWSVKNANAITITPGIGDVSATGSKTVTPSAATTYTLVASNAAGMQSKAVTINILTVRKLQPDLIVTKKPDLIVSELTQATGPIVAGISCKVRNLGTEYSTPCKLILLRDGVLQATLPLNAIEPGGSIASNFGVFLSSTQEPHTFEVKVDSDNTVIESDENNNTRTAQFYLK